MPNVTNWLQSEGGGMGSLALSEVLLYQSSSASFITIFFPKKRKMEAGFEASALSLFGIMHDE